MKLNPQQLELLRMAILRIMDANRTRYGMSYDSLQLRLDLGANLKIEKDDLIEQLEYLGSRTPPLVEEVVKTISREIRAWKITEAGMAFVDTH